LYTGSVSVTELVLGAIVGFSVAYIFSDLLVQDSSKLSIKRLAVLVAYAVKYFTVIEAKAHWSVVKAILSPKMGINPSIVRIPYRVRDDYAVVTIANSITNTPGTVVVDIDEEKKNMYVHWIFADVVEDEEARKEVSEEFESWARLIFEGGEK
ncbi:MAG: Na+/H+ antiporter subunit E, partial [Desulfurococcales archaeon]|nr:Na+/H+ antiporter subunit E [Desulfurococcales archaeon]